MIPKAQRKEPQRQLICCPKCSGHVRFPAAEMRCITGRHGGQGQCLQCRCVWVVRLAQVATMELAWSLLEPTYPDLDALANPSSEDM